MPIKIAQQTLTWIRHPRDFTLEEKLDQGSVKSFMMNMKDCLM